MIKAIDELKKINGKMAVVLNQLALIEDGEGADYSDTVIDFKWLVNDLENRLITLQRRHCQDHECCGDCGNDGSGR